MPHRLIHQEFFVNRDEQKCIHCRICVRECGFGVHGFDAEKDRLVVEDEKCVNCQRCVLLCPTKALSIQENHQGRRHYYWTEALRRDLLRQAETGAALLTGMGCDRNYPIYFDRLLLNASQVTNPPIDPLREPMEVKTFLGRKPARMEVRKDNGTWRLANPLPPAVELQTPILFAAMSFGAVSKNVILSMAEAASRLGTLCSTGEGGMIPELGSYKNNLIVQVASGRFGVDPEYLQTGRIIEIKMGQGAKPGIGGHLPGEKVTTEIAKARMIPQGTDAISPAPHHDIYSIEDLRQLINTLKEVTAYQKPIAVKIAAVHNVAAIASGVVRAGADILVVDGMRGGTGAAPKTTRDHVGLPIELAISAVDTRLRQEGIRSQVSLVAGGGIRCSADLAKIICLGADAVMVGTAALLALGCQLCQQCHTGKCSWGIATVNPELARRVNPKQGAERLVNLVTAWTRELKELMGGMGINAIESLCGNRLQLRGVGLTSGELEILDVKQAGASM